MTKQLEQKLDSFIAAERKKALQALLLKVATGQIALPLPSSAVNLHCHTFFSYNSYGYSPSKFAWLARKQGLAVAGIVDFDVLDGLDEFGLLFGGVGVIEAQVALAAEFAGDLEIHRHGFGMADVQIAVRLRRKARDRRGVFARGEVIRDDFTDEVELA